MAHAAVIGVVYYAVTHLPRIEERSVLGRFTVRKLGLHASDPWPQATGADDEESSIPYPGPVLDPGPAFGIPEEVTEAMHSLLISASGREMIAPPAFVPPAFHTNLAFAEAAPIPTLMISTPELAARKRVAARLPDPPPASNAAPSLPLPNEEIKLAEMSVTATDLSPRSQQLSTVPTSALERQAANLPQMAPESPAPAEGLALTDLRMLEGTLWLPPLNDFAGAGSGKPDDTKQAGGNADSRGNGINASSTHSDAKQGGSIAFADSDDNPYAGTSHLTTEHITLPKDGRFGVVVVGSSLGEEYPETLAMWNNRVAYTAFLHVGRTKNWILQYAVMRSAEASQAGVVGRLEAPWPYDIVRPNLMSKDLNADALLIHGFLNPSGRLESLAITFPRGFRYASFVLHALGQWQFRPALQNGHATAVEVLLIIPDELE
jgi:hypothetical protein